MFLKGNRDRLTFFKVNKKISKTTELSLRMYWFYSNLSDEKKSVAWILKVLVGSSSGKNHSNTQMSKKKMAQMYRHNKTSNSGIAI